MKKVLGSQGILMGFGAVAALGLAGCDQPAQETGTTANTTPSTVTNEVSNSATNAVTNSATGTATNSATGARIQKAVAVLHPTKGSKVQGTVTFTQEAGGVRIVADVTGLTPGDHGFHAHEHGDCSSEDGTATGGHYNPTNMPHGAPDDEQRHVGDFGNITADKSGRAHYDRLDTVVTLEGPHSIVGRGVIVHSKADDFKTQPTGDAGDRLACGVVGAVGN